MPHIFRIPKQTDRELVIALRKIRDGMVPIRQLRIHVSPPHMGGVPLEGQTPEEAPKVRFILDLHSRTITSFNLIDVSSSRAAVSISRQQAEISDEARVEDEWINNVAEQDRTKAFVHLSELVQKELRIDALIASISGSGDSAWDRFRDAQMQVLSSLEATNQRLLHDAQKQIEEVRAAELSRNGQLREELSRLYDGRTKALEAEIEKKQKALEDQEGALAKKLAEYETHEARYVARQETKAQMNQLKSWLSDSSLTKKTVSKRIPVAIAYGLAIVVTGYATIWFGKENIEILKAAGPNLTTVPWWQWSALTLRSVLPFGGFVTFIIYFIRWTGAWARQHADEELRTRARVVDIGRSSWLMEAVRDAADTNKDLPPELLRELARNLFAASGAVSADDLHPQAISDFVMQHLSSLKITTPGGEIEATRGKARRS